MRRCIQGKNRRAVADRFIETQPQSFVRGDLDARIMLLVQLMDFVARQALVNNMNSLGNFMWIVRPQRVHRGNSQLDIVPNFQRLRKRLDHLWCVFAGLRIVSSYMKIADLPPLYQAPPLFIDSLFAQRRPETISQERAISNASRIESILRQTSAIERRSQAIVIRNFIPNDNLYHWYGADLQCLDFQCEKSVPVRLPTNFRHDERVNLVD